MQNGNNTQATVHGDGEKSAVTGKGILVDKTKTRFEVSMTIYENIQYSPIEPGVFHNWREGMEKKRKQGNHLVIWALDINGDADKIRQSYQSFLENIN